MDPITTMIVTALALGAAAGLKPTAEQAVKDAYGGLKALIQRKYAKVSLAKLEEAPESEARRAVVEEDLAKTDANTDEALLRKAKELLDVIQVHAPEAAGAVGVDLEHIKAASLSIENIIASGAGVKAREIDVSGDINIKGVRAGSSGDEDPKP